MTNIRTAKELLSTLPLSVSDAARLMLELTEMLGARAEGLSRTELLALLRRALREGVRVVETSEYTVSFARAAEASIKARRDRRPTTRRDLRHFVGRMLRVPWAAERPLRRWTAEDCRNLLDDAFGSSICSYRKGRAVLSSIFTYGVRREWCERNPVQRIEVPRSVEVPIRPLTMAEVARLENVSCRPEHQEMRLSLLLMLYCGVRPAEVMRINPRTDIVRGELIIRPKTSKTGGGRVVPLRKVKTFLKKYPELNLIPRNWQKRWRNLRRDAGFSVWQADVCRHTFATYHAGYFRDLAALQLEMGHGNSSLLRTRYVSAGGAENPARYWS